MNPSSIVERLPQSVIPPSAQGLPIVGVVGELLAHLARPVGPGDRHSAVLVAEPGAGKTTVVPLAMLEADWLRGRRIVVLEPRRVAAWAAARRVASMLGEELGHTVGLRTRDETVVSEATRLEFVTEGLLTRMVQNDPSMEEYGAVVFDEFHERSLAADLSLALLLDGADAFRPDLRIVVMSATIDADRIAGHISAARPAPVVQCPGRTHPVEVSHLPTEVGTERGSLDRVVASNARRALADGARGVLTFLPGMAEIRRVAEALETAAAEVVPLHGSLSSQDQDLALRPIDSPRVILSTDIAQTSVTVDGVDFVLDSGLRRAPYFDVGTGMTRLRTQRISRAAAEQRSGRAGRTGPGRALRLWTSTEHQRLEAFDPAEVLSADLSGAVLEVLAWGAEHPNELPFLDPLPPRAVAEGRALLEQLGALDAAGLTSIGRRLAGRGLHPRLGRIMVAGEDAGAVELAAGIVAVLEERNIVRGDPRTRSADLGMRVAAVLGTSEPPSIDRRAARRARRRVDQLRRRWRAAADSTAQVEVGRLAAAGFPDRVGHSRSRAPREPGAPVRYALSGGGSAVVEAHDLLSSEPMIVVAESDGARSDARTWVAAGVGLEDLKDELGHLIVQDSRVEWEYARERFARVAGPRLGALWLDEQHSRVEPGPEVAEALAGMVRSDGLHLLDWSGDAERFAGRVRFAARHLDDWPPYDEGWLRDAAGEWLAPMLWQSTSLADLRKVDAVAAMRQHLGSERCRRLDAFAPARWTFPSGGARVIDYSGEDPKLSSRAQDFFGLDDGPRVAEGRVAVVLELLSPAGRPIQTTSDLGSFWSGSWAEVRKDMIGRYPKHDWPADPRTGGRR